jgi:hypothetical protein
MNMDRKERMMMNVSKVAAAILATAALNAGTQALAQTSPPATAVRPTGSSLALPELMDRLSREGYHDIGETERKGDKLYKVNARDAQGSKVEMYVDARTAEVLASEEDDED